MRSTCDSTVEAPIPLTAIIGGQPESKQVRRTRRGEIEELGKAYMTFCADQPLPLFPRDRFVESLLDRADATLFAIIANSLRHISDAEDSTCSRESRIFRDAAHSRVMEDVGQGSVEISTLQALCLIVFFDFASESQYLRISDPPMMIFSSWWRKDRFVADGTCVNACFEHVF